VEEVVISDHTESESSVGANGRVGNILMTNHLSRHMRQPYLPQHSYDEII
jgi:hypothetical protein